MLTVIDWIMIAAYFGLLAGVVAFTMHRQKIQSGEDLFLGGRSVGWLAIGASIFAANIGSEHLIGLAGSGAAAGLSQAHWELQAWVLVMMSWVFLPFYYKSGVSTMPEFLERRFGAKARWILSLVSLAAYVLTKISVTVFAGALFFEVMMPEVQFTIGGVTITSFWIGAIATVVLAGLYSSMGGLSAVVYTDLVQTGIILAGTLSVTGFALYHLGHSGVALPDGTAAASMVDGWAVLKETIRSTGSVEAFGLWHSLSHPSFPWLGVAIASVTIGVWYWCTDQFIIQRTLAAKDLTNARRGAIWGGFLKLAPVFLFLVPGMLGFALHHNHVSIGDATFAIPLKAAADGTMTLNGDTVFPTLVQSLLPTGFRGLVVAGMIAALMSSLASLFNSVSTLFTVDVYQKLKPATPQRTLVTIGRTTTIVMTALGLLWLPIMKAISGGGLYRYIQSVQSFLAPPIVAVFVLGLLWKRMNLRGAVWGLSLGFTLGMAKLAANAVWGGAEGFAFIQDFYFSGILLAISIAIIVVASLTAPAPEDAKTRGLTFSGLDADFKKENRASWNWIDVTASCVVVGLVICAYAYFWNWLNDGSKPFGTDRYGDSAAVYTIEGKGGLKMEVANIGGKVNRLWVPDAQGNLVDVTIGHDDISGWERTDPYPGAIIGRFANRISGGKFTLDGQEYSLELNDASHDANLHGGFRGWDAVRWNAQPFEDEATGNRGITLSRTSPDGEQGFPGNVQVKVKYTITPENVWRVEYYAVTDKPTPVNLTQHVYFNLDGSGSILDHELQINATRYLAVDANLAPLAGEPAAVEGTPFDFRDFHKIGERIEDPNPILQYGPGYDHNWCIDGSGLRKAATLRGKSLAVEVWTDQPGLQFYAGNFFTDEQPMKDSRFIGRRNWLALEPQHYPDSPNRPDFPSAILRPGEEYSSVTEYRFSAR